MIRIILTAVALLVSVPAFADTYSQQTAKEMVAVLESDEMQDLLSQEDGMGNIKGIEYSRSGRASFGPSIYAVSFKSYSGRVPQVCSVSVNVNVQTLRVMSVSKAVCNEIE